MTNLEIKTAKGFGVLPPDVCKFVQMNLFDFDFSGSKVQVVKRVNFGIDTPYSLVKLKNDCYDWAVHNFTKIDEEDDEDFKQRLVDESELEFADRLRQIADAVEKIVFNRK